MTLDSYLQMRNTTVGYGSYKLSLAHLDPSNINMSGRRQTTLYMYIY